MKSVSFTIDGKEVQTEPGTTVLEVAQSLGIYIPALCYHPDLPPAPKMKIDAEIHRGGELIQGRDSNPDGFEGCQLCVVAIEGV
ncbi:MAG: 2Fe-2S iron-sulfur cluster-binding protein, partial [Candidatus Bathyarchaeota archaeon]|nr:2Fe-2S iron-sulfur cluster-binding protein [Candidatus Bathyarchaeota archaeon]